MTSTFSQIFMALRAQNCFVVTTDYKSIRLLHMCCCCYLRLLVSITVIHFASSCIMEVAEVFYCLPAKMESFFISRFLHFVGLQFDIVQCLSKLSPLPFPSCFLLLAFKMLSFDFEGTLMIKSTYLSPQGLSHCWKLPFFVQKFKF